MLYISFLFYFDVCVDFNDTNVVYFYSFDKPRPFVLYFRLNLFCPREDI